MYDQFIIYDKFYAHFDQFLEWFINHYLLTDIVFIVNFFSMFLKKDFKCVYMFMHMSVVLLNARRGHQIHWSQSHKWMLVPNVHAGR